jgi:tRNA modification GTPase
MSPSPDDTIVSVSTPPGPGARGILRMSGPRAWETARRLCRPGDLAPPEGEKYIVYRTELRWPEGPGLGASVLLCRGPASYTREDVAEIHTVSSPPVLGRLLERALDAGLRHARPGEFTRRALVRGRITVTQAEGVVRLIAARNRAEARLGAREVTGALARRIEGHIRELTDILSLVELRIDFSDQDVELVPLGELGRRLDALREALRTGETEEEGKAPAGLWTAVHLTGPVNAGKSSLFNALTGSADAIVHDQPGTTRDRIHAPVTMEGLTFLLADGAGWGEPGSPIEHRAMAAQARFASVADLCVHVVDGSLPLSQSPRAPLATRQPELVVVNKTDLPPAVRDDELRRAFGDTPVVRTSVRTGEGMDHLRATVVRLIREGGALRAGSAGLLNARQRASLRACGACLSAAAEALEASPREEIAALELREAVTHLSEMAGLGLTEAVLDRIFADFCIGK